MIGLLNFLGTNGKNAKTAITIYLMFLDYGKGLTMGLSGTRGWRHAIVFIILIAVCLLKINSSREKGDSHGLGKVSSLRSKTHVDQLPIESVAVGRRVLAFNPELTDQERSLLSEPDWSNCYEIELVIIQDDGHELESTFLRPYEWIVDHLSVVSAPRSKSEWPAAPPLHRHLNVKDRLCSDLSDLVAALESLERIVHGLTLDIVLPELGIAGTGCVKSIRRCDGITCGPGQVVTATFKHSSTSVIDLIVASETGATHGEAIGVTPGHVFWSQDREQFVSVADLKLGEQVRTFSGSMKRVSNKLARPGPEVVYNIEVFGEETYFVGQSGILVHNSCATARSGDVLATPDRLQNKLDAWRRYAGPLNLADWSKKYDQLQINRLRGKWREDVSRWLGLGSRGSRLYTPVGDRIPDAVSGVILREIKDGYVSLDKFVRTQIGKDFFLQRRGFLPEWHFYGGASGRVLSKLQTFGIPFFLH